MQINSDLNATNALCNEKADAIRSIQSRLSSITDSKQLFLRKLGHRRDVQTAYDWVNRHAARSLWLSKYVWCRISCIFFSVCYCRFRGEVLGPVGMYIQVTRAANYTQSLLFNRIDCLFVCLLSRSMTWMLPGWWRLLFPIRDCWLSSPVSGPMLDWTMFGPSMSSACWLVIWYFSSVNILFIVVNIDFWWWASLDNREDYEYVNRELRWRDASFYYYILLTTSAYCLYRVCVAEITWVWRSTSIWLSMLGILLALTLPPCSER